MGGIQRDSLSEARWLESSILKTRLATIAVVLVLFALLPWPYTRWIQVAALAGWILLGLVAAWIVRRARSPRTARWTGRVLLAIDMILGGYVIVLYVPFTPEAWIALILFILVGAARDGRAGAIAMGAAVTAVLLEMRLIVLPRLGRPASADQIALEIAIVWLIVLTTSILVQTILRHSEALAAQGTELEQTARRESELHASSQAQAERMRRLAELSVLLLGERDLKTLLDRILEVTLGTFGFQWGQILVAERDRELYKVVAVRGCPPDLEARIRGREWPFAQMALRTEKRFELRPSVFYVPVERQQWNADPSLCLHPERLSEARPSSGAWHEADLLIFTLTSSTGETIGLAGVGAPLDGRVPSDLTLDAITLFARIAAAAIENVYIVAVEHRRVTTLSEQNVEIRRRFESAEELAKERGLHAQRLVRILEVSASIFQEHDLDRLLRSILSVTLETFGFRAGTLVLRDERRRAYVRRSASGYDRNVEGEEIAPAQFEAMMNPQTKVRDTYYYAPMELDVDAGVNRHMRMKLLPRTGPGDWHERDIMLFPIFDSSREMIGALSPDSPKDGKIPNDQTIRMIEVFAQLAGLAVEFSRIRESARLHA